MASARGTAGAGLSGAGVAVPDDYLRRSVARPYAEVRALVRDGDVMLCAAHDRGSRLIRWATRSAWSHCAVAFWIGEVERVIVLECVETLGVRAVPLSAFVARTSGGIEPYPGRIVLARHAGVAALDEDGAWKRRMTQFAFDRLGARFSQREVAKIGLRILLGRFGWSVPGRLRADDEYICSEYVALCLERVGVRVPWNGRGFVAPADVARDPGLAPIAEVATGDP